MPRWQKKKKVFSPPFVSFVSCQSARTHAHAHKKKKKKKAHATTFVFVYIKMPQKKKHREFVFLFFFLGGEKLLLAFYFFMGLEKE